MNPIAKRVCILWLCLFISASNTGRIQAQNVNYCLNLEPRDSNKSEWVNPGTRTALSITHEQPAARLVWQGVHWLESTSADGQYSAYMLVSDDPTQRGDGDLVIRSIRNDSITRFPIGHFADFDGLVGHFRWSHRGHRIAFFSWEYTRIFYQAAGMWQEYTFTAPQDNLNWVSFEWSADDAYFGFQTQGDKQSIVLLDTTTFAIQTFPVHSYSEAQWSPQGHDLAYSWSEGGSSMSILTIELLRFKGDQLRSFVKLEAWRTPHSARFSTFFFTWTADGRDLAFFRQTQDGLQFGRYNLNKAQFTPIIEHVVGNPYYFADNPWLIIPWRHKDGLIVVDAVSTDGRQQHPILTAKDKVVVVKDTEDKNWSAMDRPEDIQTGNYTAIVWNNQKTTQLTIVNADGTHRQDVALGALNVEEIRWASLGRQLFYTGTDTAGSVTVGFIDMLTGNHNLLHDHLRKAWIGGIDAWNVDTTMSHYTFDADQTVSYIWTIDGTGTARLLIIHSDGKRDGEFRFYGQFKEFWSEIRPTSDGKTLLVALHEDQKVSLQLVTEQTTRLLLDGVADVSISFPWSPDDRWFSYVYPDGTRWITVIANRDGDLVWHNTDSAWHGIGTSWKPCDLF